MHRTTKRGTVTILLAILLLLLSFQQQAYADQSDAILEMPLEELMQQQVSSITKKLQRVGNVAAATYVITADDISQSGATNIPEVLRLAPGVNVAAINNNRWAVSIRGFNSRGADKLLVLVDGRTIYPEIFPGTIWENNEIPLELIERIEIIRGPAASLWGNNAVNGVINIITKSAHDTVGTHINLKAGSEQRLLANGSQGWIVDDRTSFRIHASSRNTDDSKAVFDENSADSWQSQTIGFRLDKELSQGRLLVQGGAFNTRVDDQITVPRLDGVVDTLTDGRSSDGVHLQAIWEHYTDNHTINTLQGFLEYSDLDWGLAESKRKTIDIEFQQQSTLLTSHDFMWGVGVRLWNDDIESTPYMQLNETRKNSYLTSFFIQDDISVVPEKWVLTLGSRIEKRTDIEAAFLPTIRLLWTPNIENSVWFAVSKAVRQPTRSEKEAKVIIAPPSAATSFLPVLKEDEQPLRSEYLYAVDFGWQRQWEDSLSTDFAGFIYDYDDFRSSETVLPTTFPPTFIPLIVSNELNVQSYGAELTTKWQPSKEWQFILNYSWRKMKADYDRAGSFSPLLDSSPEQSASLQFYHQINTKWQLSGLFRYVDSINVLSPLRDNGNAYHVPSYSTLDLKLNYKLSPSINLSITGQNLLERSHKEFIDELFSSPAAEIQRSVYVGLEWSIK